MSSRTYVPHASPEDARESRRKADMTAALQPQVDAEARARDEEAQGNMLRMVAHAHKCHASLHKRKMRCETCRAAMCEACASRDGECTRVAAYHAALSMASQAEQVRRSAKGSEAQEAHADAMDDVAAELMREAPKQARPCWEIMFCSERCVTFTCECAEKCRLCQDERDAAARKTRYRGVARDARTFLEMHGEQFDRKGMLRVLPDARDVPPEPTK